MDKIRKQFEVLGVKVDDINLELACDRVDGWISAREKSYICVAPVSTIIECQDNTPYREVINKSGMVTPDGMPLVWLGKAGGSKVIERTYGPDLMLTICERGQEKGWRHFLYGGTEESVEKLEKALKQKFPKIEISGKYSPPFRELSHDETQEITNTINNTNSDIVWVGLGAPKQDFWISQNRGILNAPVLAGVGAAFDFISGTKKQAPKWMQNIGLEWLFRLSCEPRRLWKRYLLGNSKFVYLLIKDVFSQKIFKKHNWI